MTIVAGFTLKDRDLLFLSDTRYTYATMQLESTKIFVKTFPAGHSIFAITGTVPDAKMVVQHCERELLTLPPGASLREMRDKVEEVTARLYDRYLKAHAGYKESDVNLLAGFYSHGDSATLFISVIGIAINELYGYECLGTGESLGHFILRPKYSEEEDFRILPLVFWEAAEAFEIVKQHEPYCGRSTDVVALSHTGVLTTVERIAGMGEITPAWEQEADRVLNSLTRQLAGQPAQQANRQLQRRSKRGQKGQPPSQG